MEIRTIVQQVEAIEKETPKCIKNITDVIYSYENCFITKQEFISQLHEATLNFYAKVNISENEMSNASAVIRYKLMKNI